MCSITPQEENMQSGTRSTAAIAGSAALALALLAGCSSSKSTPKATSGGTTGGTTASSTGVDAAAAALVPLKFKSKGTLTIATDATYPPNENIDDSGKIVGFDVDLGNAIAAKLGLTAKITNVSFDNIQGGITGGSY